MSGYQSIDRNQCLNVDPVIGMAHDEGQEDPQLGAKRQGLTRTAGRRLADIGMIRFDEVENSLVITDLGRIAAKYYLKHETVEIFSELRRLSVVHHVEALIIVICTTRSTFQTQDERGRHSGSVEYEYRGEFGCARCGISWLISQIYQYSSVPSTSSQGE